MITKVDQVSLVHLWSKRQNHLSLQMLRKCERGDSNPPGVTRQYLKLVRLPISPRSRGASYTTRDASSGSARMRSDADGGVRERLGRWRDVLRGVAPVAPRLGERGAQVREEAQARLALDLAR